MTTDQGEYEAFEKLYIVLREAGLSGQQAEIARDVAVKNVRTVAEAAEWSYSHPVYHDGHHRVTFDRSEATHEADVWETPWRELT